MAKTPEETEGMRHYSVFELVPFLSEVIEKGNLELWIFSLKILSLPRMV